MIQDRKCTQNLDLEGQYRQPDGNYLKCRQGDPMAPTTLSKNIFPQELPRELISFRVLK